MSKTKRTVIIIGGIVLVFVVGSIIFGGPENPFTSFGEPRYEKPPEDPQERREWISQNFDITKHEQLLIDYQVPTRKEIETIKSSTSLARNYPKKINGVFEMGFTSNVMNLLYFGDELADVGVNTHFIAPLYQFKNGQLEYFMSDFNKHGLMNDDKAERAIAHALLMAKQQEVAVVLMPDYPDFEDGQMEGKITADEMERQFEEIALNLAKIGEEYNVEYLVPTNQIEMILHSNGFGLEEIYQRTNNYYARVVPKIKQIYSGKILYKMGGLGEWERYNNISLEGADLFGFGNCYTHEPDFISQDINQMAQIANKMSQKAGIPWMVTEFWVRTKADQLRDLGEIRVDYPFEEYYQAGIESFKKNAKEAIGFTVTSWLGVGKVRDTDAVPLIEEFFASRK